MAEKLNPITREEHFLQDIIDAASSGGGGGGGGGTTDYEALSNKPKINGVELTGDVDGEDIGIKSEEDLQTWIDTSVTTALSTVNDDYNELLNLPRINGVTLKGYKTASDLGLASQTDLTGYVSKAVLQATIDSATITLPESARDLLNVQYGETLVTDSNAVALMSALMGSIYDGLIDGGADGMISLAIANGGGSRDYIGSIDFWYDEVNYALGFDYNGNKYVIRIGRNTINVRTFVITKTPLSGNIPPIEIPNQAYQYLASLPEGSTDVTDTLGSSLAQIFQYIAGLPDSVKAGVTLKMGEQVIKPFYVGAGETDNGIGGEVMFVPGWLSVGPQIWQITAEDMGDDGIVYSITKTSIGGGSNGVVLTGAEQQALMALMQSAVQAFAQLATARAEEAPGAIVTAGTATTNADAISGIYKIYNVAINSDIAPKLSIGNTVMWVSLAGSAEDGAGEYIHGIYGRGSIPYFGPIEINLTVRTDSSQACLNIYGTMPIDA